MLAYTSEKSADLYKPRHKPNQILSGIGHTVVVTGWTPKQVVAQKLGKTRYAAIGNLYSPTRGINFLIRNLLANPGVHFLVVLDATSEDRNAGGCQCLVDFFKNGFTLGYSDTKRQCWVIESSVRGYIDFEVSSAALEKLRETIKVFEVTSVDAVVELIPNLENELRSRRREAVEFKFPETKTTVYPGPLFGHRIEGKTVAETWIKILQRIRATGVIRPTGYDGQWQELIALSAVVSDEPEEFYFPEPNFLPCDRPGVDAYLPQILEDAPYQPGVKYTYGQRIRSWFGQDQVEAIIRKLIAEIDSASAVISIWDAGGLPHAQWHPTSDRQDGDSDHEHGGSPCLNHLWVRIVDDKLSLVAIFRSNDMFGAWPSNAMGLRALQRQILNEYCQRVQAHFAGDKLPYKVDPGARRNLTMGPLITLSESAHIYDDTFEAADALIKAQYNKIFKQELRRFDDPCGNFIIETLNKKLKVSQTTSGSGEIVREYMGTNSLNLVREICRDNPAIAPTHSAYLVIELEKALSDSNYLQK